MTAAIRVENLGKRYRVVQGGPRAAYRTFRETLAGVATAPLRKLRGRTAEERAAEDFWALKDVSFEVQPGEVVGIIGRNGAGKSTLLKILSRITKPTTGRVELNGRVGSLLEVGTGFHPELTGRENVYLNGSILGMSRREINAKFDEIVAFAEVEKFLDTPVKRYSSGMYVRLAFAVAAHLEPEILIVDEVLAVGDVHFQNKCLGRMRTIGREGRTVLFVSHNMAALLSLCQRAIQISSGRLSYEGEPAKVVEKYLGELSTLSDGIVDLKNHPARSKGAFPLLQEIQIVNALGQTSDIVGCGEQIRLRLKLSPISTSLHRPQVGIGIDDSLGYRVCSVATYLSESLLPPLEHDRIVECEINSLPLAPGYYTLSMSAGSIEDTCLDALPNAVTFQVVANDFYGNGRAPTADLGKFLVQSQWCYRD